MSFRKTLGKQAKNNSRIPESGRWLFLARMLMVKEATKAPLAPQQAVSSLSENPIE